MPNVICPLGTQDDWISMAFPENQYLFPRVIENIVAQKPCDSFASRADLKVGYLSSFELQALPLSWKRCANIK